MSSFPDLDMDTFDDTYDSRGGNMFYSSQFPINPKNDLQISLIPADKSKDKTFNDPVHGFIVVEEMLVAVIDTPYFQRLRDLKQLGAGYYVFPGSSHNRFEHCIGTAHLAGEMCERLRTNGATMTDKDILLVKLAALCHDIGHGPYSHCFDGLFVPSIEKQLGKKFNWTHEDASEMMLKEAISMAGLKNSDIWADPLNDDDILFICHLINPKRYTTGKEIYPTPVYPHLAFCYDILSNSRCSVDVDKFDYLERDCLNSNVKCGFRLDLIMNNCKVINNEVCFHKKVAFNLMELFHTRYSLFKQVYSHRKVKCVEYMLCDAMIAAEPVLHIVDRIFDPQGYLSLTDSIIPIIEFYPIDTITNSEHKQSMMNAQHILQRLRKRDLYRFCSECLIHPTIPFADVKKNITEANVYKYLPKESTLQKDDLIIQYMTLNYANKDKNPIELMSFYSNLSDTESRKIIPEHLSLLAPIRFQEHYIRIFIRKNDNAERLHAGQALTECLKVHFNYTPSEIDLSERKHALQLAKSQQTPLKREMTLHSHHASITSITSNTQQQQQRLSQTYSSSQLDRSSNNNTSNNSTTTIERTNTVRFSTPTKKSTYPPSSSASGAFAPSEHGNTNNDNAVLGTPLRTSTHIAPLSPAITIDLQSDADVSTTSTNNKKRKANTDIRSFMSK